MNTSASIEKSLRWRLSTRSHQFCIKNFSSNLYVEKNTDDNKDFLFSSAPGAKDTWCFRTTINHQEDDSHWVTHKLTCVNSEHMFIYATISCYVEDRNQGRVLFRRGNYNFYQGHSTNMDFHKICDMFPKHECPDIKVELPDDKLSIWLELTIHSDGVPDISEISLRI